LAELPAGAVTFLFTDVEGSTQLVKQLRDRYPQVLADHRGLLREAFTANNGHEIDTQGDAFFVAFASARDAVLAAVDAQRALAQHAWPDRADVRVRIGIHTGQASPSDGRYTGVAVHRAARISAAGHGGQILISQTTHNLLEDEEQVIPGVELLDLGAHQLKDLDRPVQLYQVDAEGLGREFPALRTEAPASAAAPEQPYYRRRTILVGALAGVIAAAVAIPIFALGGGGSPGGGLSEIGGSAVGVIESRSGQVEGAIETPEAPTAVASGLGYVWAASADANAVYAIDPKTDTVHDTIAVDDAPAGVAVAGGSVWVTSSLAGTVSQIDPEFGPVQSITVGNGPSGIAAGGPFVWVTNTTDHTVSKIRARDGRKLGEYPAGSDPTGIAVGKGAVWVASKASGSVLKLSANGDLLKEIHVGDGPAAVAVGAGGVWVANSLSGTVSKIDPDTGDVVDTIQVGGTPVGITVSRGSVWVANEADGTVVQIDPGSNEPTTVRLLGRPTAIAAGVGAVYVAVRPAAATHRGGTLRVAMGTVDTVDPAGAYSPEAWRFLSLTNDSLLTFRRVGGQPGYELVPDLAASMPVVSQDGRTYTFELRPGIRYSTGDEVKASDVRSSFERMFTLRPHAPEEIGQSYGAIEGAQDCTPRRCDLSRGIVTDDAARTVTFHLREADPIFLYKLALTFASVLPAGTSLHQAIRRPLPATGTYRIASVAPGRSVRLVRNPRFKEWSSAAQPAGRPDEIVLETTDSQPQRVSLVSRGRADLTTSELLHPFSLGPALRPQLRSYPLPVTFYFFINPTKPPFDDVRARRALNYAIDRNKIMQLAGDAENPAPTCQVLPPNFPGFRRYCPYTLGPTSAGTWRAPDLVKAQRLVAASGTKGDRVTVFYPRSDVPRVGRYVVSLLESLGYRVRASAFKDQEDHFGAVTTSSPNLAWSGWLPNFPTAADFIAPLFACGSEVNFGHFCDRRLQRKMDRALKLQQRDPAAAIRLWAELDRGLTDTAAWLPLYNRYGADFVSKRVRNYQYNPQWGALLSQMSVR
jgi:YVTN family beta-propeller protein